MTKKTLKFYIYFDSVISTISEVTFSLEEEK